MSSAVAIHGAIRAGCAFTRIESTLPRELVAELFTRLGNPSRAIVVDPRYAELLPDGVEAILPFGHEARRCRRTATGRSRSAGLCAVHVRIDRTSEGRDPAVVARSTRTLQTVACVRSELPAATSGPKGSCTRSGRASCSVRLALPCVGCTLCIARPDCDVDRRPPRLVRRESGRLGLVRGVAVARDHPSRRRSSAAALGVARPVHLRSGGLVARRAAASARRTARHDPCRVCPRPRSAGSRISISDPTTRSARVAFRSAVSEPGVEVRLEPLEDDPSTTELVIARPRAFGYLGDPELTARRFFTDEDGTRWWRSARRRRVDDVRDRTTIWAARTRW